MDAFKRKVLAKYYECLFIARKQKSPWHFNIFGSKIFLETNIN